MPDERYEFLSKHCEEYGIKHTVYDTNIFEINDKHCKKLKISLTVDKAAMKHP